MRRVDGDVPSLAARRAACGLPADRPQPPQVGGLSGRHYRTLRALARAPKRPGRSGVWGLGEQSLVALGLACFTDADGHPVAPYAACALTALGSERLAEATEANRIARLDTAGARRSAVDIDRLHDRLDALSLERRTALDELRRLDEAIVETEIALDAARRARVALRSRESRGRKIRAGQEVARARGARIGRPRNPKLTADMLERARAMLGEGMRWREVAAALHVPTSTLHLALTR